MTAEVVFMLEEPSMKVFLEELLPRVVPDLPFRLIPHEGKSDLERSLPRKLRAWRTPGARFVVVRDQDASDCRVVKQRLLSIAAAAGRSDVVVRIACRELEAWLLGDPAGLCEALGRKELRGIEGKAKFREPDRLERPSNELRLLLGAYSKVASARAAGARIAWDDNSSVSFRSFIAVVQRLAGPAE